MLFHWNRLVVATALLVTPSPCSGAPLRGTQITHRDDIQEEGGLAALRQTEEHTSRGLLKKGGISSSGPGRKMAPKGKGGGKGSGECKISKSGKANDDCTLWDLITDREDEFSLFIEFVERSGRLGEVGFLDSIDSEMTIFVPTNEAFLKSPELFKYLDTDAWTRSHLRSLLRHLTLEGESVPSEDFVDGQALITEDRSSVPNDAIVNLSEGNPPVLTGRFLPPEGINIIEVDNFASNGVLHVLDGVVKSVSALIDLASAAKFDGNFTLFTELLEEANLVEWLRGPGPIQGFAIPNDVFSEIQSILDQVLPWLGIDFFNDLKNDPNLRLIMENHLILGPLPCFDGGDCFNTDLQNFTSVAGYPIQIIEESRESVNQVGKALDFINSNGAIDVIQGVLFPPVGRPEWLKPPADSFLNFLRLISFGPSLFFPSP